MIIDLEKITETPPFECDVCIIGTGAAGLVIASEMLSVNFKVMLIEGGGLEYEKNTQALYDVEIADLPHPGSTTGRFRVHGGSTTTWGGQVLPLAPLDFERRSWIAYSGWPISFDDLKPYYQRACQFLFVDQMNFDSDLFSYLRTRPPAFDTQKVLYHFSKWSPTPSIRENYLDQIQKSKYCTLLLHANVTRIKLNDHLQSVQEIEVCSLNKHRATVKAKYFVLCVGGIETARLLLWNNIGNQYDLVGRYFQDHPSATIGFLKTSHPKQIQQLFNMFHKRRLKYSVRCTASPEWQQQHQALNVSTGITFVENQGEFQNLREMYHALRRGDFSVVIFRKLPHVIKHLGTSFLSVMHYLSLGRNYHPGAQFQIGLTSEQEPNPESRILLSDRKDALGISLSRVQWKLTEFTQYTMRCFVNTLKNEFQSAKIGDIEIAPWLKNPDLNWRDYVTDQFHHIGTARMHDSEKYGVVDRHCRVHGIENFYIGSSAVFPTGGHSNPTLTIIALCMRLADRLKCALETPL